MTELHALVDPELTLGDRLNAAVRRAGVTKQDLARDLGVTPTSLSNWLAGRTRPGGPTLRLLAMRLGVSVDWIESGDVIARHVNTLLSAGVRDHLYSNDHIIDGECPTCERLRHAMDEELARITVR